MYHLGVDLGATNVRAVVGDGTTVVGRARGRTPDGTRGRLTTDAVCRVVREACDDAAVEPESVVAASIGAMGTLDLAAGTVDVPANLPDDVGPIPLVGPIGELLDTDDVTLMSDTLAGAVGERFHAHPDVDDLVYLTVSSGIGAGVVAGGEAFVGLDGNAGEVGHTTIDADGTMTCACGRPGHWEAYCSGNAIPRFARALHDADPVETAVPVERAGFTAIDLFEHAGEDAFADRVIERLADLNTLGVANVVHAYAPAVVSVGGAVALNNPEHVVDPVRDRLDEALVVDAPRVVPSELGEDAVLKGALASAAGETGDRSKT